LDKEEFKQKLLEYLHKYVPKYTRVDSIEFITVLLDGCEELGMLPPLQDEAWSDYSENISSGEHAERYAKWMIK